jgi:alpha-amylase/alpha-mannosidase (GH57 family)
MAKIALCIHGHFYQPPREDPLTGEIPIEPGAAPYRNWNERIHVQCYYPNTLLQNFERISFNIGPTLMEWMFDYDPETQANIIHQNQRNFDQYGVGNAMAQAYNHTILPLSLPHDRTTQIRWGIADYEFRFGHKPEGMWLPETAVDLDTLTALVDCGIKFTILAPWQADTIGLDPTQP